MFGHRNYLIINHSPGPIIIGCCCELQVVPFMRSNLAKLCATGGQSLLGMICTGIQGTKKTLLIFKLNLVEWK